VLLFVSVTSITPIILIFLVGPLDGTKALHYKNVDFTVNIALIDHGVSTLCLVCAPALDVLYSGMQGLGAVKEDNTGRAKVSLKNHSTYSTYKVIGIWLHSAALYWIGLIV
jgi:3'(2'), 5'-bisphosphate nucleotidase